jgi:acetyl-CoA synthetase
MSQPTIESILQETRFFEPPAEFSQAAHIKSLDEYRFRIYGLDKHC